MESPGLLETNNPDMTMAKVMEDFEPKSIAITTGISATRVACANIAGFSPTSALST